MQIQARTPTQHTPAYWYQSQPRRKKRANNSLPSSPHNPAHLHKPWITTSAMQYKGSYTTCYNIPFLRTARLTTILMQSSAKCHHFQMANMASELHGARNQASLHRDSHLPTIYLIHCYGLTTLLSNKAQDKRRTAKSATHS